MKKKEEEFKVSEVGTRYLLPKFRVIPGEGIKNIHEQWIEENSNVNELTEIPKELHQVIEFVRGAKDDGQIPKVDGLVHEQLLGMMIYDLGFKNTLVPSRETAIAIRKLEEALMWLNKRLEDRAKRDVQGTYED